MKLPTLTKLLEDQREDELLPMAAEVGQAVGG
jgi:hypothetical protein